LLGQLDLQRSQLERQLTEGLEVLAAQFKALNELKDHALQRRKATDALNSLRQEIDERTVDLH